MDETIFPPSPSWFLPNILATRNDGSVAYGSKNNIVILKLLPEKKPEMLIIRHAHTLRITAVAFSPPDLVESVENTVVSCSEDGFVKLWKIDSLMATMGHKGHWEQSGEVGKIISLDWSTADPYYIVSAAENNTLVLWDTFLNTTIRFSFHILGATVVKCCPYNEKVVAVGGKTGQIYIISLTGKGDVLYRLRGHDNKINSLTWCPVPYNVFKMQDIYEEFLLASVCQNKEIFIWRAGSDGKCETKFQVPTSPLYSRDGRPHGKVGTSFSYVALCWLEPYKIYLSSNFGELIYFDIKFFLSNKKSNATYAGQKSSKNSLNFGKLANHFFTKGLFAIAGSPVKGEIEIYKDTDAKSELKFPIEANDVEVTKRIGDESSTDSTWAVIVPEESSLLWIAGQDRKLIACELKSSKMEMILNFNTVNGVVYCAAVSPHDPNTIAIGCGDGMIRLWNLTEPCGDIQVYWQKIKDRVMSLDWHPTKDGLLAYGTSEGRVGLVDTKSNKLPSVFKPGHPQPIYNLSWGPQFPSDDKRDPTSNLEFDLYATGDNTLALYNPAKLNADPLNLSKIISFPCKKQTDVCWKPDFSLMAVGNEDGSICLVEPSEFKIVHVLLAYKKLIHSIVWHPSSTSIDSGLSPYQGYFTSGSTDNSNEIRVFNCKKGENEVKVEQVASLKGHHGQIQSVSWCPHISGRLVSSSTDNSVQIWDVLTETPLVNFTPAGKPMFSMWSPIDPDFILTGCKNDFLCVWKVSTQTKVFPTAPSKNKKPKNEKNIQFSVSKEITTGEVETPDKNSKENGTGIFAVAKTKTITKTSKEPKMFTKAWKGGAKDELKTCYSLLKNEEGKNNRNYSLPFLRFDEEHLNILDTEEESPKKGNESTEVFELALWKGNIKDLLEEKMKSGKLNDFLVSLAPTVSPRFWQEACFSYSKTLSEKKYYRKAASYLLVCNKLYEAIHLLLDADLYLEALFIAKSRLPKSDPVLEDIVRKYGEWLYRNGSFLKACQCFIYLEDYLEVAKICGRSGHAEYLSLAALAAKKSKLVDLESMRATNALFKCFETNNLELAREICEDHSDLKHLGLLFFVYRTIHELDAGEKVLKTDLLSHVKESFDTESVVFPSCLPELFQKHAVYRSRRQVLSIVAQEFCFAVCSRNLDESVSHVIKALSTSYRYSQNSADEVHPSFKFCRWLAPEGFLSSNSLFVLKDDELSSKIKSLRAFLCASIIRHLNDENESCDAREYFDVIMQLEDGLLDADSCKYFKNLIEVKVCETELLENRSNLSRKILENGKTTGNGDISENITTYGDSSTHDKINGHKDSVKVKGLEIEVETQSENGTNKNDAERLERSQSVSERDSDDIESAQVNAEGADASKVPNKERLEKNLDLLNRLKTEIEVFETQRISSPHPIPVYAMLKKLCEGFPENESANFLYQSLEEKFRQMN